MCIVIVQAKRQAAAVTAADARARAAAEAAASAEAGLAQEVARAAPLFGNGLELMTASQLGALARLHEEGLQRARAMLVCPAGGKILSCVGMAFLHVEHKQSRQRIPGVAAPT